MLNRNLKLILILTSPIILKSAEIVDYDQQFLNAAETGDVELVVSALENKANVDAITFEHNTALHWAAKRKYLNIVAVLLKANASKEARNLNQDTPLSLAVLGGGDASAMIVNELLKAGAMVNVRNAKQHTPLHWSALDDGNLETCHALLKANAIVDIGNIYQDTPLHFAAQSGNIDKVIALLTAEPNIDLTVENINSNTSLDLVIGNRHLDITKKQAIIKAITDYRSIKIDEITKIICENSTPKLFVPLCRLIALYVIGEKDHIKGSNDESSDKL